MKGPTDCVHLTVEVVLAIHRESIRRYGGSDGLRSRELLESAVAAPQAGFGGTSAFRDLVAVAGAYLYYLCANHPFIDGNKRVALGACLVFLKLNGASPASDSEEWENLTMGVAAGVLTREQATGKLRELLLPRES